MYHTINASCKELLEEVFFQESSEFSKEDGTPLGVTASGTVIGYETLTDEIRVTVRTKFRLLYVDENGFFFSRTAEKESTRSVRQEGVTPSSCVFVSATVCDVNKKGNNPVLCQATVRLTGWFLQERELRFLDVCSEKTFCKSEPVPVESLRCLTPGGLTLSFADETKMNVSSLLDYSAQATVSNVYPSQGMYRIEGDTYVRIVAQNEDGACFSQLFSHPFSTEISDESVSPSGEIDVSVSVRDVVVSLSEDDKRNVIFDLTLNFEATASFQETVESVRDVYSVTNVLNVEESDVTLCTGFCFRSLRDKATALVTPKDGANELFGILYGGITASYTKINGQFFTEGIIQTQLLYKNGKDRPVSLTTEIPYQIALPVDSVCNTRLQPEVSVTNLSARLRNGGEIDVTSELILSVKGLRTETVHILSDVQIGEPKEPDEYAVTLYLVRSGETLWDVAKALNTSEEILRAQNPESGTLSGGEKIIFYREDLNS